MITFSTRIRDVCCLLLERLGASLLSIVTVSLQLCMASQSCRAAAPVTDPAPRPHIILVMADDMGWGQTGFRNHPLLKTPNLDAMAAAGLCAPVRPR